MTADQRPDATRVTLVSALGEVLRDLTTESDRLAHRFAHLHDLHPTDFRALTLIHAADQRGAPLTPGRLAAQLALSSGAATYLVERLVATGHVERAADPADRRRVILTYADHGRETAAAYFVPLGRHLGEALTDVSEEDLATAHRVLSAMHESMTTYDHP